jgi:lipopolysaccharide export system protein LptA
VTAFVVGVLAASVAGVTAIYWWGFVHRAAPPAAPSSLPENIHQQSLGYTVTRSDGQRRVFTIHAGRTLAYKEGGSTVLQDVLVEFFGRSGQPRHDILRTRRCTYNRESGTFASNDTVTMELNAAEGQSASSASSHHPPVYIDTSGVSYKPQGDLVLTDAPVKFRVGPVSGTSVGLAYATQAGWLELKNDVAVNLQLSEGRGAGTEVHLTGKALRYDKLAGTISVMGPVQVEQSTGETTADQVMVKLNPEGNILQVMLTGNVHNGQNLVGSRLVTTSDRLTGTFDPATHQLRHVLAEGHVTGEEQRSTSSTFLKAAELAVNFEGNKEALATDGTATGDVQVTVDPAAKGTGLRADQDTKSTDSDVEGESKLGLPDGRKTLTCRSLKFVFRPDGRNVKEAETLGPGKVAMAGEKNRTGQTTIDAGQFLMSFNAKSEMEALVGKDGTKMVAAPAANLPPGTPTRESTSGSLRATFDPATNGLLEVIQSGNFNYQEGERRARAESATLVNTSQQLTLKGSPKLWDDLTRVKADEVTLDMKSGAAFAEGRVQSTQIQASPSGKADPPVPINVMAERMQAERQSKFIRYEGHVRAWRGADVVESSSLDVFKQQKRLSTGNGVMTSHLLAPRAPATAGGPPADPKPVTVKADHLDYYDEGRQARYSGNVHLWTESTTLTSDKMEITFSQNTKMDASQVDHAIADGHVVVVQPTRRATGEHADYVAKDDRVTITGGSPTVYDAEKGFTTGQRLTFYIHDDRLFVDGGDKSPTLSKHPIAP